MRGPAVSAHAIGCGRLPSVKEKHSLLNSHAGCAKRLSSKAAASEEARRTLRYVESLSDARTPLADFLRILLSRLPGILGDEREQAQT